MNDHDLSSLLVRLVGVSTAAVEEQSTSCIATQVRVFLLVRVTHVALGPVDQTESAIVIRASRVATTGTCFIARIGFIRVIVASTTGAEKVSQVRCSMTVLRLGKRASGVDRDECCVVMRNMKCILCLLMVLKFSLVVLGTGGVGKTAMTLQYTLNQYVGTSTPPPSPTH